MDMMFNIQEIYVGKATTLKLANWTNAAKLGKTQGGGSFTQEIEKIVVQSDQSADPEHIAIKRATKTLKLNLLEAKPDNLALAFGAEYENNSDTINIASLPEGIEKSIKIVTRDIGGYHFEIEIARAMIEGNAELSFSSDNTTVIPLTATILSPESGDPVRIKRVPAETTTQNN